VESKRTLMGEAPRLLLIVAPALAAAIVAALLFPAAGSYTLWFRGLFVAAAIVLSVAGVVFWISAAIELVRAWNGKKLATRGAYALCRHPIFAVWIWFVLPVVSFLTGSWYFLAADVVFVIASLAAAPREERELIAEFGSEYEEYRKRVRSITPIPRILK